MARHSVVFSNVRGPDAAACFANARLRGLSMVFSNPLPQVGVLTYDGRVHFTFTLDADATVDARALLPRLYLDELRELASDLGVDATGMVVETPRPAPPAAARGGGSASDDALEVLIDDGA